MKTKQITIMAGVFGWASVQGGFIYKYGSSWFNVIGILASLCMLVISIGFCMLYNVLIEEYRKEKKWY